MHKDYEKKAPKGVEVRPFLYFHSLPSALILRSR
jgi:hypothetical protein